MARESFAVTVAGAIQPATTSPDHGVSDLGSRNKDVCRTVFDEDMPFGKEET